MEKITNEERARIFASYLGAKAIRFKCSNDKRDGKLKTSLLNIDAIVLGSSSWYYKIKLKPLRYITDKHAIEVAKILCNNPDNAEYHISERGSEGVVISVGDGIVRLIIYYGGEGFVGSTEIGYIPLMNTTECVDQLRAWNYNIGHGKHSARELVELGIVVDK